MKTSKEFREARRELRRLADPQTAEFLQRFFKTGPGEYGEGDRFLGIRVPQLRGLMRSCKMLPVESVIEFLHSPWHEERLFALLVFVEQFRRGSESKREIIHNLYLNNTDYVNNWDLVDTSAEYLVGGYLDPGKFAVLEKMAGSESVWERRIAIMSTFHWVRQDIFKPTLRIATLLLYDSHDLIHKATGWMLREIGKRDQSQEEAFLLKHYQKMPRTMLRYAIERFQESRRQAYLKGEVQTQRD